MSDPSPSLALTRRGLISGAFGLALAAAGCGGGGSSFSSAAQEPNNTGRAVMTIVWPTSQNSRLIPQASAAIKIVILDVDGKTVVASQVVARASAQGNPPTSTVVLGPLPTGTLTVTAASYPDSGTQGVPQASGSAPLPITAGQQTAITLTMNSTIDHLEVTPANPATLTTGKTLLLTVTAKDASGAVVLTSSATVQWRSLTPLVASVDTSGTVKGLMSGNATIEVEETESQKTATVSVTVADSLTSGQVVFNPTNGHYYKAVSVPAGIKWDAARDAAIAAGGYLATITSAAENQFVFSLIDAPQYWHDYTPLVTTFSQGPWLGGYQPDGSPEPAGGWTWVTGEPWAYTDWEKGSPNNDSGLESRLYYAAMGSGVRAQTWDDVSPISALYSYIIEWDHNPL